MQQTDIDSFRNQKITPQKLLIDGEWREGGGAPIDVVSPINGKIFTAIAAASVDDVNAAVRSARVCFESGVWSRSAPSFRKKIMLKIAEIIEKNALELAVLGVRDNGTEITMAIKAEPGSAAGTFRYYAEAIDKVYDQIAPTDPNFLGLVMREPLGVIGAIVPWNFPLMIGAWKIAAAIASGNSVVLKPSEEASLSLLRLGAICLEAGLPEGVLNIITGDGAQTGAAMAAHMDIDAIGFTGSGKTGRALMQASAQSNLKRLFLELGGKSPNVVFADTKDIASAAMVSAAGIFRNSGEVCVAGSRLIVEASIAEDFTQAMIDAAAKMTVGDPLNLSSNIGAITTKRQLENDLGFVNSANDEGANLAYGGQQLLTETGGYYMSPTIFTNVTKEMNIFQNEVFGPLLTVTPFDTEEEAISLANATQYGLASGVWTENLGRAHRMIRALRAGVVHVNTYGGADNSVPLPGVGQSGNGSDKSLHAMEKYTSLKTAWIKL